MTMNIADSLVNVAAGIGIGGDKQAHSTYIAHHSSAQEVDAAYRTTWLRKIIDIKAEDTFREWRTWQGDKTQIGKIEREERRLNLRDKFIQADRLAQVSGGAALFLGGLPGKPDQPVPNNIPLGGLKYVTVLPREQCTANERVTDPLSPDFNQPSSWRIGAQTVHPSRVVIFKGDDHPNDNQYDGYGLSVWDAMKSSIMALDSGTANIVAMLFEAKIDVFKIPNLTENFATAEYTSLITKRLMTANILKSTTGALIMDAGPANGEGRGEEFETKQLSFASLPDLLDRFMMLMAGMSDIPQTRLYGRSPQGMNATGDHDAKNHAAMISARQKLKIDPAIRSLDDYLIKSALGSRPDDLWPQWNPLYTTNEKEGAEIEKAYADGLRTRIETGSINADVLAKAETNRMIETGRYPGIEDAMAESENDGITDPDDDAEVERMQREAEAVVAAADLPVAP